MKKIKIITSWVVFLVGCAAVCIATLGALDALLCAVEWIMDATLGWWAVPAALVVFLASVVTFFWLNPMKPKE